MSKADTYKKLRLVLTGRVQGVGLRPEIFRLANRLKLSGGVKNENSRLVVNASGDEAALDQFIAAIEELTLPGLQIDSCSHTLQESYGRQEAPFVIENSTEGDGLSFLTIPDRALCGKCMAEIVSPDNSAKRSGYLFNSCAQCGPRYSILFDLPFDRENTSMNLFSLCPDCQKEYNDPDNRRFHAETTGCPRCGPQLTVAPGANRGLLDEIAASLQAHKVWAVQATAGFHLICDARSDLAVARTREIKQRPEKPFALLYDSIESIEANFHVSGEEKEALLGDARPVVLLSPKHGQNLSFEVNRGFERTGVFLPDSGFYHLLLQKFKSPLVATSFNLSGEPVIASGSEIPPGAALPAAVCNRKIVNRCDDSVLSFSANPEKKRVIPIRLSKGFAPLTLALANRVEKRVMALGGNLKNSVTLASGMQAVVSPPLADPTSLAAQKHFKETVEKMLHLHRFHPEVIVSDAAENSFATALAKEFAEKYGAARRVVYHHHAHALSLMADHNFTQERELFCAAWDGAGMGPDRSVWGGEFLEAGYGNFKRVSHFRPFYQPGGAEGAREPWKTALSLLFDIYGEKAVTLAAPTAAKAGRPPEVVEVLYRAWAKRLNMPPGTSAGRLFDAAASLLDICHHNRFEGEAPMRLEERADMSFRKSLSMPAREGVIDWRPLFAELFTFEDPSRGAAFFINSMARLIVESARDKKEIGLTGGVFQNARLLGRIIEYAKTEKIRLFTHTRIPCNDGGLSLGQALFVDGSHRPD